MTNIGEFVVVVWKKVSRLPAGKQMTLGAVHSWLGWLGSPPLGIRKPQREFNANFGDGKPFLLDYASCTGRRGPIAVRLNEALRYSRLVSGRAVQV
jgi:hypothetical protein